MRPEWKDADSPSFAIEEMQHRSPHQSWRWEYVDVVSLNKPMLEEVETFCFNLKRQANISWDHPIPVGGHRVNGDWIGVQHEL